MTGISLGIWRLILCVGGFKQCTVWRYHLQRGLCVLEHVFRRAKSLPQPRRPRPHRASTQRTGGARDHAGVNGGYWSGDGDLDVPRREGATFLRVFQPLTAYQVHFDNPQWETWIKSTAIPAVNTALSASVPPPLLQYKVKSLTLRQAHAECVPLLYVSCKQEIIILQDYKRL